MRVLDQLVLDATGPGDTTQWCREGAVGPLPHFVLRLFECSDDGGDFVGFFDVPACDVVVGAVFGGRGVCRAVESLQMCLQVGFHCADVCVDDGAVSFGSHRFVPLLLTMR